MRENVKVKYIIPDTNSSSCITHRADLLEHTEHWFSSEHTEGQHAKLSWINRLHFATYSPFPSKAPDSATVRLWACRVIPTGSLGAGRWMSGEEHRRRNAWREQQALSGVQESVDEREKVAGCRLGRKKMEKVKEKRRNLKRHLTPSIFSACLSPSICLFF